jgi:hypothetical protein
MGYHDQTNGLASNAAMAHQQKQAHIDASKPPCSERDQSPVENALDSLMRIIESSHSELTELRARLSFVTDSGGETACKSTSPQPPSASQIEGCIHHMSDRVNSLQVAIRELRLSLRV